MYFQDTVRIATGCQDGLMRIYDTCTPSAAPTEYKVSSSIADGITKLCWSTAEPNLVILGKKSGVVEKWDVRCAAEKCVLSAAVPGGETVMDFEVSNNHGVIMVASGKKVRTNSLCARVFELYLCNVLCLTVIPL